MILTVIIYGSITGLRFFITFAFELAYLFKAKLLTERENSWSQERVANTSGVNSDVTTCLRIVITVSVHIEQGRGNFSVD